MADSLTRAERAKREDGISQARRWIERAGDADGVTTCRKTFPRPMRDGSDVRVDIEVLEGKAFIPDPDKMKS